MFLKSSTIILLSKGLRVASLFTLLISTPNKLINDVAENFPTTGNWKDFSLKFKVNEYSSMRF